MKRMKISHPIPLISRRCAEPADCLFYLSFIWFPSRPLLRARKSGPVLSVFPPFLSRGERVTSLIMHSCSLREAARGFRKQSRFHGCGPRLFSLCIVWSPRTVEDIHKRWEHPTNKVMVSTSDSEEMSPRKANCFASEIALCESGLVLRCFCSYKEEGNVTKISL